ncbi:MAG: hypothetical protein IID41_09365 [Planctomycetes bacterium]|nr:hypothetical protein [Planctomycetota bacterium]
MKQRSTQKPTSADAQPLDIGTLQAALPESTPEFQIMCLKQNYTLLQAKDAWADEELEALKAKVAANERLIEARAAEIEELEAAAGKPGLVAVSDNVGGGAGAGGSARETVEALVAEQVKLGKTAQEAYAKVMIDNPDLRAAFVTEHNERYGRPGLPDGR